MSEDDDMVLANMSAPAQGTFAVFSTEEDGHMQLPLVSFAVFESAEAAETAALGMVSYAGELLIAEQELEDYGLDFVGYWVSSCESFEVFLKRVEESTEEDDEEAEEEESEEESSEEETPEDE